MAQFMTDEEVLEEERMAQQLFPAQAALVNNQQSAQPQPPTGKGRFLNTMQNIVQNKITDPLQYSLGMKLSPRDRLYQMQIAEAQSEIGDRRRAAQYFNDLTPESAAAIGLSPAQLALAKANPNAAYDDVVSRAFSRETYSNTPQYGVDKLGNKIAYQLGDRGGLKVIDYMPGQDYDRVDTGGTIQVFKKGTRILVDTIPKTMTPDQQARLIIDERKQTDEDKDKQSGRRKAIREGWNKSIKVPQEAFFAFEKVRESADLNSAYGDVALLTNFMKVLDPGSIVRESEFEMIANTGGLPVAISNAFRKAANGELLESAQRENLIKAAAANLKPYVSEVEQQATFWKTEAEKQGVSYEDVIVNPFSRLPDNLDEKYNLEPTK